MYHLPGIGSTLLQSMYLVNGYTHVTNQKQLHHEATAKSQDSIAGLGSIVNTYA